jgi:hypothetical protein
MAAIALAESAGEDQALNSIGACGLWQIHPYEAGCLHPTTNAHMAGDKLRTQGLTAWETYTNGSYKQFMGASGKVPASFKLPGPLGLEIPLPNSNPFESGVPGIGSIPNAIGSSADVFKQLFSLLKLLSTRDGWIRIGKVAVGLFLLLTGVLGMANIQTTQTVMKTAGKAAEVAAAA